MDNPYNTQESKDDTILKKDDIEQEIFDLEEFKATDEWHDLEDMDQIHLERQHTAWVNLVNVMEDRIRHF